MKVLMVLTSHSELGNTGKKTGFWVEEFAAPYYLMLDACVEITLGSPIGGQPPIDPKSKEPDFQTEYTKRFDNDEKLQKILANTLMISQLNALDFDAVFYPGGHGPLWDLAVDSDSVQLIESFYLQQKPIAFVCHAPAALLKAKLPDGEPLIKGKKLTGFSNTEEEAVQLTGVVPFLLEDELKNAGAQYSKGPDWGVYVQADGLLLTGQNPASSAAVAQELLTLLKQRK